MVSSSRMPVLISTFLTGVHDATWKPSWLDRSGVPPAPMVAVHVSLQWPYRSREHDASSGGPDGGISRHLGSSHGVSDTRDPDPPSSAHNDNPNPLPRPRPPPPSPGGTLVFASDSSSSSPDPPNLEWIL
jgi:hypothetical protein